MCLFGKKTYQPEIPPAGTIDINTATSILLNKAEAMGSGTAQVFMPDGKCKVYERSAVSNYYALSEVSSIKYEYELHDCDDYAAELFGKFAGLVWTDKHALNWFIDESNTFWFVEPQTRRISQTLEPWQGSKIRFFIGR